ncbi:nickel/cobalt efflux transporter [Sulfurospirillum oryzae]|uniref:nickel/cobalt efflux transporter n=1 Tax=Sulfurospirillum oryzae TaxID=2976535 RepID=UPI0021E73242|nr:nickel/cobalt efflux transporter [Sulfurospirillum oryzae]
MTDIASIIQSSSGNAWLFLPSAILLGALHGLEPGHSKTMMAAFIIAIKGTVKQSIMLGLAATISHTAVVWAIALLGMYFGARFTTEAVEPYLEVVSGCIMVGIALWTLWQTWKNERACFTAHEHDDHHHSHEHSHDHGEHHHHEHHHSKEEIIFEELGSCNDAHELAHAKDIKKRFSNKEVTNWQILLFGLTGGLIPCPASITVLLICLQLKQFTLGIALVLAFSVGLALTLVLSGVIAALSMRHLSKKWSGFGEFAKKAPYVSGGLILLVGLYIGYQGLHHFL